MAKEQKVGITKEINAELGRALTESELQVVRWWVERKLGVPRNSQYYGNAISSIVRAGNIESIAKIYKEQSCRKFILTAQLHVGVIRTKMAR